MDLDGARGEDGQFSCSLHDQYRRARASGQRGAVIVLGRMQRRQLDGLADLVRTVGEPVDLIEKPWSEARLFGCAVMEVEEDDYFAII